ncbi:hypothetical protein WJX81_005599 [Elliptochloris bilobata]|uniref:GAF domain-containing protein n=1 Tax=Elliptochloris bilobata TaxID=381761 RepID=A0AAW1QVM9_9CHLO
MSDMNVAAAYAAGEPYSSPPPLRRQAQRERAEETFSEVAEGDLPSVDDLEVAAAAAAAAMEALAVAPFGVPTLSEASSSDSSDEEDDESQDDEGAAAGTAHMSGSAGDAQQTTSPAPGTPAGSREDPPVAPPIPDAGAHERVSESTSNPEHHDLAGTRPLVAVALRVAEDSSVRVCITPTGASSAAGPAAGDATGRAGKAPVTVKLEDVRAEEMEVEQSGAGNSTKAQEAAAMAVSGRAAEAGGDVCAKASSSEGEEESESSEEESSSAFTSSSEEEDEVTGPPTDAEASALRAELAAMDEDGRDAQDAARGAAERQPPPAPLDVEIAPDDELLPAGRLSAVLDGTLVVQVPEGGRVFDEGAVLVLADSRAPLGRVEEVFGPVTAPLYALRYAPPGSLPKAATPGAQVSALARLSKEVCPQEVNYKGYDTAAEEAGAGDEEFAFSDDEAEAAFWRAQGAIPTANPTSSPSSNPSKRKERDFPAGDGGGRGMFSGERGGRGGGGGGGGRGGRGGQPGGRSSGGRGRTGARRGAPRREHGGPVGRGRGPRPPVPEKALEAALMARLAPETGGNSVFGLLADTAQELLPHIVHVSVLLLPEGADISSQAEAPGMSARGAPSQPPLPDLNGLLRSATPCGLDWGSVCAWRLGGSAGAMLQRPPEYPLACTAAFHVARTGARLDSTDYATQGPHFADWAALAAAGAGSMVAVPLRAEGRVAAVLCLASSQARAFEGAQREVWALAWAAGPYLRRLNWRTPEAELARFARRALPPLLEEGFARIQNSSCMPMGSQGAACDAAGACGPLIGFGGRLRSLLPGDDQRNGAGRVHPKSAAAAGDGALQQDLAIGAHAVLDTSEWGALEAERDWSDFALNLAFMAAMYLYFSDAGRETGGRVLDSPLSVALAVTIFALDFLLMGLRWFSLDYFFVYGGTGGGIFPVYRLMLLPAALTVMAANVLACLDLRPGVAVQLGLWVLVIACLVLGMHVRFFHLAPNLLACAAFAAAFAPDFCVRIGWDPLGGACLGFTAGTQLALGLAGPALIIRALDAQRVRVFLPHVQARPSLLAGATRGQG